jgi:uncharacterized protein (DUF1778 family)
MKMLAQNPDGDTITAQEFATARQDLTNLLQNPSGYVPEQVAAINERVQLQRQRQRERIVRQDDLYDPFVDSLDQPDTGAMYDPFVDSLDQPDTGAMYDPFVDSLEQPATGAMYDPFIDSLDQPDVETEEVFETPGFQGQR